MKKNTGPKKFLFEKRNYRFLFLAIFVIALGFILMAGGGSDDPAVLRCSGTMLGYLSCHLTLNLRLLPTSYHPFYTFRPHRPRPGRVCPGPVLPPQG